MTAHMASGRRTAVILPDTHYATEWAPSITNDPPEWTLAAACQYVDAEIFFPEKGGSTREAKQVCAGCPVTAECLAFALEHQERFGSYGGYTTHRRRDELPCGSCHDAARRVWLARKQRRRSA